MYILKNKSLTIYKHNNLQRSVNNCYHCHIIECLLVSGASMLIQDHDEHNENEFTFHGEHFWLIITKMSGEENNCCILEWFTANEGFTEYSRHSSEASFCTANDPVISFFLSFYCPIYSFCFLSVSSLSCIIQIPLYLNSMTFTFYEPHNKGKYKNS